jgi:hypothetical protein
VRLFLPTRIPLPQAFGCAIILFIVELFQRTNVLFALLFFAFVILSVLTFNLAGGFSRLTGAYTFWFSLLIVIFGVFWKAIVAEPAESNLQVPLLDMSLYALSMVMLLAVTLLNKKMDFRSIGVGAGFSGPNTDYTLAGLGCIMTSVFIAFAGNIFGQAPGGFISALAQINFFFPIGIILSTAGALKESGGRRSMNFANTFGIVLFSLLGVTAFSKQGMLTPFVCWVIGALYMKMRIRVIHVISVCLMLILTFTFIGPLSQSRDLQIPNGSAVQQAGVVWYQITHWSEFQHHVDLLNQGGGHDDGSPSYYNESQGAMIERLSMMPPDDRFNAYTAKGNYFGMAPIIEWFGNLVPRFLYPTKTNDYTGNFYAHKVGGYLSADDTTTGISFSPVSSAYSCEGWGGILWLMPAIWILVFTTGDFIAGDMDKYPWGLLVVVYFGHTAPEGLLSGLIYFISYGNLGLFIAIVISTRIAPILGALFTGKTVQINTRAIDRRRITPRALPVDALPQE